jgi:predicted GIY-YIG superfamily endonuclease
MHKQWHVYVLRDPRDGFVRYVGMTCSANARSKYHKSYADGTARRKLWTAELAICGCRPEFQVIATFDGKDKAKQAETRLIVLHQNNYPGRLLNAQAVFTQKGFWINREPSCTPSPGDGHFAAFLSGSRQLASRYVEREQLVAKRHPELALPVIRALYDTCRDKSAMAKRNHGFLYNHSILEIAIKRLVRKHIFAA